MIEGVFDGLLEAIGVVASLIGIWEFVSRREFARRLRARISHVFATMMRAIRRKHVDPLNRITLFDRDEIAETNITRMLAGSYRRKTQVIPGNHDIDVAVLR